MMATQWILLIMEDGLFHEESVCYAIKLAHRIHCSISVLMLQSNAENEPWDINNAQQVLKKIMNLVKTENITTQGQIRYGDKASEFLKHLADNPSFLTIVWGGEEKTLSGRNKRKTDYWFAKIKTNIRCPVIRPTVKDNSRIKREDR
jgi:hypothetical protein